VPPGKKSSLCYAFAQDRDSTIKSMPNDPNTIPDSESRSERVKSPIGKVPLPQYETAGKAEVPTPGYLEICWPLVAGLILGYLSPYFHDLLANDDRWVTWVVFPFVELAGRHDLRLSPEMSRTLPWLILYLQFPLEGLLTMWNLRRRASLAFAVALTMSLHAAGAFALWLLSLTL